MNITEIKKKLSSDSFIADIVKIAHDPTLGRTKLDQIRWLIFNHLTGEYWDNVEDTSNVKRYKVTLYQKDLPEVTETIEVTALSQELAETYATRNGCMEGWCVLETREIPEEKSLAC